jgi:hypothetical protein
MNSDWDWKSCIEHCYQERRDGVRPQFREGATLDMLARAEAALGHELPSELRELLRATDGLDELAEHDGEWIPIYSPVWSCAVMVARNQSLKSSGAAPSRVANQAPLYFADAGVDGILFALVIGDSHDPGVHAYYPLEQEWRRISPSLQGHLEGWKV